MLSDRLAVELVVPAPDHLNRLPVFVTPLPEEAFVSWAARLGTGLQWTADQVFRHGFGLTRRLATDWWTRPDDPLIRRVAQRSGLTDQAIERLTFRDWQPACFDDEAAARFAGWRYEALPPERRDRGIAICPICLRTDAIPYLRLNWFVGWVAICPAHGVALVAKCRCCQQPLRAVTSNSREVLSSGRCLTCHAGVSGAEACAVSPSLSAFQDTMLLGKRSGRVEPPSIGSVAWPDFVMLCDSLLGCLWRELTTDRRGQWLEVLKAGMERDFAIAPDLYGDRLSSLALIAWLLRQWPNGPELVGLVNLARRWIAGSAERVPRLIGPTAERVKRSGVPTLLNLVGS